ncbi:MAG: restriction endonuclease subunit S [Deltaproteobacteria bacterium]|nr:restriction endonuclease subunit S [Deltaproteobacteria bacterium]
MNSIFSNLPNTWVIKNIPDVFFFQEGPGVRKWQFREKGIKLLNGSNINNGILDLSNTKLYLDEAEAGGPYRHFLANEGDLVIASSGVVVDNFHNKIAFVKKEHLPLCMNTSTIRFQVLDDKLATLEFLKYFLKTKLFKIQIGKLITGSAQLNFGPSHLKKIQIPLPPLDDQIRIATVLTRAERLIAKRKESIKALDELLKSTFLEMFGDPVRNEKGWEKKVLKDVCLRITDGTHFSPPITKEGIPYITAKHVRENKVNFFSNPWYISEKDHKDIYKRCDPKSGDILYIKDGATTGYAAINRYNFEFSMLSSLALLRVDTSKCNSEYLCYWLNNRIVKAKILQGMSGGAIQRLTLTKINVLPVNLPPLPLQNQFAAIVEKVESIKAKQTQSLAELENLYASLSQRAFKGELDLSRVVGDEPETELRQIMGETRRAFTKNGLNLQTALAT